MLNNFHKFLSLKKSEHDDRQQDLYRAVLCRPETDEDYNITLTRTDNTEVKVDPEPLLSCVRGSRIPIRDIKTIEVELSDVEDWMWDVFSLLTSGGAVIQEIQIGHNAVYSPVIHEMIQQGDTRWGNFNKIFNIPKQNLTILCLFVQKIFSAFLFI